MIDKIISICSVIYDLYNQVKANSAQVSRLTERIQLIESAISPFKTKPVEQLPKAIKVNLKALKETFEDIEKFIKEYADAGWFRRVFQAGSDEETFADYTVRLGELNVQLNLGISAEAFMQQSSDVQAVRYDAKVLADNRTAILELNQIALYHFDKLSKQGSSLSSLLEKGLYDNKLELKAMQDMIKKGQLEIQVTLNMQHHELKDSVSFLRAELARNDKRLQCAVEDVRKGVYGIGQGLGALKLQEDEHFKLLFCQMQSLCKRFDDNLGHRAQSNSRIDPKLLIPLHEIKLEKEAFTKGSFGHIFRGNYAGEEVVVKLLPEFGPGDEEQFYREVEIMSRLRSKRIAQLQGACVTESRAAIIMSYYPEKGLNNYLESHKSELASNWEKRAQLMKDVIAGVVYLHTNKVIHRDLKSPNILVDEHGRAYISDFGLSSAKKMRVKSIEERSQALPWMAPEYFDKGSLYEASDIYSLGVILLEIATLKPPMHVDVLTVEANNRRINNIPQTLPKALQDLMKDCLTFNAKDRPTADKVQSRLSTIEWRPTSPNADECYAKAKELHKQKQLPEALLWYQKAGNKGSLGGITSAGLFKLQGLGGSIDKKEGINLLHLAASKGHARAYLSLVEVYGKGDGVPQDYRKAYELAAQAKNQPDATDDMKQQAEALYQKYKTRYEAQQSTRPQYQNFSF